ncbi:replication-relaxation family protein [Methylocystis sp. WRRC1]|uniref:replication-relaxation family protein n=1 Tax=Methylocystis sp. WRRC1 TaxID=1732014 RepID=UPI001D14E2DC
MRITDNDIRDIFEPLSRHAQLTTRQLVAFGARHPILTKARLGALWHGTAGQRSHWLHRLSEDILLANHLSVDDMHRLGADAEALLRAKGIIPSEDWVANSRIGGNSTTPSRIIRLAHDHMASDIALDIEIGARAVGAPYKSHIDILRAAPAMTRAQPKPLKIPVELNGRHTLVEPDALFAIGDRHYALEADKATESIKGVIVPKILAYREIVAAGIIDDHLGINNLCVLFATTSEARMKNVMQELALIAKNGRSTMFGFRAEPGFGDFMKTPAPTGRLFAAPWKRVGHDDLILAG